MDLQDLLLKYNIEAHLDDLLIRWKEPHRRYHALSHLLDLNNMILHDFESGAFDTITCEKLLLISLFHDIIYDPLKTDNEQKSADFFHTLCLDKNNSDILAIKQAIIDTSTHEATAPMSEIFNRYDMNIVERDFDSLVIWESGIYEEYKVYGNLYKAGRLKFLRSLLDKYPSNSDNLSRLITYVEGKY